jgi:hypothetical protein
MLVKQACIVQSAGGTVSGDDAQMELPIQHTALYGIERCHMQIERHVRRAPMKTGNRLRYPRLGIAGGFVEHRNLQLATHTLVNLIDTAAKRVGGSTQLGGLGVDFLTFGRQCKTGPATAAQAQAQAGFQVFNMAADSGAADVELQFGSGHAAAVGHRPKHAQQAQVHVTELTKRWA